MSDPPLNVLLLAGRLEVRGSSAYTLRLAKHLPGHGVSTAIVCSDAGQIEPARQSELSLREYRYQGYPVWRRFVLAGVRRDLSDNPPDLIHIQSWSVLPQGMWLARKLRRPFVVTAHDFLPPRRAARFYSGTGRRVIAVSESVKCDLLARRAVPEPLLAVIRSGVEVPADVPVSEVLDGTHTPVVGTAGPLEAIKGLPFFLGAAQKVLAINANVEFLVSGAGPEESNLRRLARELGIGDHVTFAPSVRDFSQPIAAMDIYCLPSLRQGLGTIMLEAMALGRPVIATGVGGVYSAIRDGETGLAVPPSDSGELAQRILELLEDPPRARAIAEAGRRAVCEDFGVERMVAQTAALYREVVAEATPSVATAAASRAAREPARAASED
jgi:glycosyltransferase involved in cell wall biosynthesis